MGKQWNNKKPQPSGNAHVVDNRGGKKSQSGKPKGGPKGKGYKGPKPNSQEGRSGKPDDNPAATGKHQTKLKASQLTGSLLSTDLFSAAINFITSYNDTDFLRARCCTFNPNNANGLSTRQDQLWYGMTSHIQPVNMKDLTTGEIAAVKAYMLALMDIMQDFVAIARICELAPAFCENLSLVTSTYFLLNHVDRIDYARLVDDSAYVTPSWLEPLIQSINPIMRRTAGIMDQQNLPSAYFIYWVPHLSTTALNTAINTLLTNSLLMRSACAKLGIELVPWKASETLSSKGPVLDAAVRAPAQQFFANTFHMWGQTAADAANWYYPDTTVRDPTSGATWFASVYYYWYEELHPGGCLPLEALMPWFHVYNANNPHGCTALMTGAAMAWTTVSPGGATLTFAGSDRMGTVAIGRTTTTWIYAQNSAIYEVADVCTGVTVGTSAYACAKTAIVGSCSLVNSNTHWAMMRCYKKYYPATLNSTGEVFWKRLAMHSMSGGAKDDRKRQDRSSKTSEEVLG